MVMQKYAPTKYRYLKHLYNSPNQKLLKYPSPGKFISNYMFTYNEILLLIKRTTDTCNNLNDESQNIKWKKSEKKTLIT